MIGWLKSRDKYLMHIDWLINVQGQISHAYCLGINQPINDAWDICPWTLINQSICMRYLSLDINQPINDAWDICPWTLINQSICMRYLSLDFNQPINMHEIFHASLIGWLMCRDKYLMHIDWLINVQGQISHAYWLID
jgi:hypothetical protein